MLVIAGFGKEGQSVGGYVNYQCQAKALGRTLVDQSFKMSVSAEVSVIHRRPCRFTVRVSDFQARVGSLDQVAHLHGKPMLVDRRTGSAV